MELEIQRDWNDMSDQAFGYPMTLAGLREFCHPGGGPLSQPIQWGVDTVACNGWVVVRLETAVEKYEEHPEADRVRLRIEGAPWDRARLVPEDAWRNLAERRATLLRYGSWPAFGLKRGKWNLRTLRMVGVGDGFVTTEALLQMVARLPRAEIAVQTLGAGWLPFRFRGGTGMLWKVTAARLGRKGDLPPARFALWRGNRELFDRM